jgi:hypothetical protein
VPLEKKSKRPLQTNHTGQARQEQNLNEKYRHQ